jgi:RHS repeat-associated protein
VLADGTNTYLYGRGRIGEQQPGGFVVHLGDALGSVRQLVDSSGVASFAHSYEPYGELLNTAGSDTTSYGFSGEWTDGYNGLLNLRSRMYSPATGRFLTKDSWQGNFNRPLSLNTWNYVEANPVNLTDPIGMSAAIDKSGNEVVRFIVQRIREDSKSEVIQAIYELNNTHYYKNACSLYNQLSWWEKWAIGGPRFLNNAAYLDSASRFEASAQFGCLVADAKSRPICGQWDYKADISRRWGEAQTVDFSTLGINEEVIFYYDIWANFHFGYLGMVGGFSEESLLTGAAIEHAASNLEIKIQDDPSDRVANLIGIELFKVEHVYKLNTISENLLLWWIYIEKSKLNKAEVDDSGNIIRTYR